jgi:hypothetical protein
MGTAITFPPKPRGRRYCVPRYGVTRNCLFAGPGIPVAGGAGAEQYDLLYVDFPLETGLNRRKVKSMETVYFNTISRSLPSLTCGVADQDIGYHMLGILLSRIINCVSF